MNAGEVRYKISGDNSQFEQDTSKTKEIANKVGGAIKGVFAGATAVIGAVGTATVSLIKSVADSYGEYEQLAGGVQKLFGESSDVILKYANDAFKTAQISANDYLQTVTSFSASMISSLGGDTAKASEIANQAIIDMADNANTFGTSMESVQNAYQGFAKQNYTMLDNLKLGYGGTREEMQRLLDDANRINAEQGIMTNYTIDNFSDISQAIHVVQENMGIAGTSMHEASTTIQGSLNMLNASWQNLITGLGDANADIDALTNNVIESFNAVLGAFTPLVNTILSQLPKLLNNIMRQIMDLAPTLLQTVGMILRDMMDLFKEYFPQILSLVIELGKQIGSLLMEYLPFFIQLVTNFFVQIVQAVAENAGMLVDAIIDMMPTIINSIMLAIPDILNAVATIFIEICKRIPELIHTVMEAVLSNLPIIIEAIIAIVQEIIYSLPEIMSELINYIPEIISLIAQTIVTLIPIILESIGLVFQAIFDVLPTLFGQTAELTSRCEQEIVNGSRDVLKTAGKEAVNGTRTIFNDVGNIMVAGVNGIKQKGADLLSYVTNGIVKPAMNVGQELVNNISNGLKIGWQELPNVLQNLTNNLFESVRGIGGKFLSIGAEIVNGIAQGIANLWNSLVQKVRDAVNSLVRTVRSVLHIASPSKVFANDVGRWIPEGIAEGVEKNQKVAEDSVTQMANSVVDKANVNVSQIVSGISSASEETNRSDAIAESLQNIVSYLNKDSNNYAELNIDGLTLARALFKHNKIVNEEHGGTMITA